MDPWSEEQSKVKRSWMVEEVVIAKWGEHDERRVFEATSIPEEMNFKTEEMNFKTGK